MRVRMKTLAAGVLGVVKPGEEREVSDADARQLISGGYAELVTVSEVIETAALQPQEYAAKHIERKRRKRQ